MFYFTEDSEKEPPTALLWVYFYLTQHFDYQLDTKRALQFMDAALEHTPLLIELYALKAKIYKVSRAASKKR